MMIIFVLLLSLTTYAADPSYRISITVGGEPAIQSEVSSYIKRELRSLKDVTLSDFQPDYVIKVMAFSNELSTGRTIGFSMASLVLTPFHTNAFLLGETVVTNAFLLSYCTNFSMVEDYRLRSGPNLRALCGVIVTDFDSEILEFQRRLTDRLKQQSQIRGRKDDPK